MIHLLNAAVMPQEGHYTLIEITAYDFATEIKAAHTAGMLKHYIGYENTLELLQDWLAISLGSTNVNETLLSDGETFYVCRLRRRLNKDEKLRTLNKKFKPTVEDFIFYRGTYTARIS